MNLAKTLVALAACAAATAHAAPAPRTLDVLITGGKVYDGELTPPRQADIGVRGDRIVFVGDAKKARVRAKQTLPAEGLIVAPGFIDAHVHAEPELDAPDAQTRQVTRQIMQGVTTSVIGVDGEGGVDVGHRLERYEAAGVGQNVATYVGFGAVRRQVLGEHDRAPNEIEVKEMRTLVARAMCEGAIGLSSGLFYAPQSFASTEEVIAVAKEAGLRGGIYDTHMRDEGDSSIGVVPSLEEAIKIGRDSGAPLHLAHIKVTRATKGDGEAMKRLVELIDAARAAGQPVTADHYAWTAANTGLDSAIIPRWAQDGGREAMLKRFDNEADAARIASESKLSMQLADRVLINSAPGQPDDVGKRLSEIAKAWGVPPIEAAMRLLKSGDVGAALFVMTEADVRVAMVQPWVMSSSDGRSGGHPRAYASFPKLWAEYVMANKVLTPEQFVHRSTALPADTFGMRDRGRIRVGAFADIVAFDADRFLPRATYTEPRVLAEGVLHMLVNGKPELANGKLTGTLAGRGLRKTATAGTCP